MFSCLNDIIKTKHASSLCSSVSDISNSYCGCTALETSDRRPQEKFRSTIWLLWPKMFTHIYIFAMLNAISAAQREIQSEVISGLSGIPFRDCVPGMLYIGILWPGTPVIQCCVFLQTSKGLLCALKWKSFPFSHFRAYLQTKFDLLKLYVVQCTVSIKRKRLYLFKELMKV